jgi:Putative Ig domain
MTTGGAISGTPTAAGSANVTVKATDATGRTATGAFTFTIAVAGLSTQNSIVGAPIPR